MTKGYEIYMTYGKRVVSVWTDGVYQLIEDMDGASEFVKAVKVGADKNRYDLLCAWLMNWEGNRFDFRQKHTADDADGWEREKAGLIQKLRVSDVRPADEIRFITPCYDTKFIVPNFGLVSLNGELRRVVYIDSCHFGFINKKYTRCPDGKNHINGIFHICEFSEDCERNGVVVTPVNG